MVRTVSMEPLVSLLKRTAPAKAGELDDLLARIQPVCELDDVSDSMLFEAIPKAPPIIRIGVKCVTRLKAHAYVAGICRVAHIEYVNEVVSQDELEPLL